MLRKLWMKNLLLNNITWNDFWPYFLHHRAFVLFYRHFVQCIQSKCKRCSLYSQVPNRNQRNSPWHTELIPLFCFPWFYPYSEVGTVLFIQACPDIYGLNPLVGPEYAVFKQNGQDLNNYTRGGVHNEVGMICSKGGLKSFRIILKLSVRIFYNSQGVTKTRFTFLEYPL